MVFFCDLWNLLFQVGTCYAPHECREKKGQSGSSCALGYGTCCTCKFAYHLTINILARVSFLTLLHKITQPPSSLSFLKVIKCPFQVVIHGFCTMRFDDFFYTFDQQVMSPKYIRSKTLGRVRYQYLFFIWT